MRRLGKLGAAVVGIALVAACGGQTSPAPGPGGGSSSSGSSGSSGASSSSGSSSGSGATSSSSGSSSGAGFGCGDFVTTPSTVDPMLCQPQLLSTTSCGGQVCSWTVELPCPGDAGVECATWCQQAAPPGTAQGGTFFCQKETLDGGPAMVAQCGGCGV